MERGCVQYVTVQGTSYSYETFLFNGEYFQTPDNDDLILPEDMKKLADWIYEKLKEVKKEVSL